MTSLHPFDVTVVMPALNEEANIADAIAWTLEAFQKLGINGEIIVVNDGSHDRTQEIVDRWVAQASGRVSVLRHGRPRGIGASFWEGVDVAQGEVVVMLPGDNENDPYETLRYVRLLDHVDIVVPFIFNREVRPFLRNALSFLYRFIINTTFSVNFNYTNGTVLYRRSIIRDLGSRSDGFFFQTDILIRAVKRGYLFAEVPYRLGMRKTGRSKAVTFPSLWKVARGYARLVKDYYFVKSKAKAQNYSSDSQTALRRADEQTKNG